MKYRGLALLVVALALASTIGCRQRTGRSLEVLDLRLRLAILTPHPRAGWPLLVRYSWTAGAQYRAADRPLRAFVHFLSSDGATLINDDHTLQPQLARLGPLATISYERVVFPPEPFPGELRVEGGLFDTRTGARLGLGTPRDAEVLATFAVAPAAVRSRQQAWSGFYFPDGDPANPFLMSRWMGQEAEVTLPAVVGEGLLVLRAWTNRAAFEQDPALSVAIGDRRVAYSIGSDAPFALAVPVARGSGPVRVRLRMDETFVPAAPDTRRLGLCLTNLALVPRESLGGTEGSNVAFRSYP